MNGKVDLVWVTFVGLFWGFPSILIIFLTYNGSVPLITKKLFIILNFLKITILSYKKIAILPLLQILKNQLIFKIYNDIIIKFKIVQNE